MEVLSQTTVLFTLVLASSLLIERFMEFIKHLYDMLDSRLNWHRFWTNKTYRLKDRLENRLNIFEHVKPEAAASVLKRFEGMIMNDQGLYRGKVPVLSGDLVRASTLKVIFKIMAFGLGIALAFSFNLDLLKIVQEDILKKPEYYINSETIRKILTGITIGLGSEPVHKIIRKIEEKRNKNRKTITGGK
jgi:hypothetical protein